MQLPPGQFQDTAGRKYAIIIDLGKAKEIETIDFSAVVNSPDTKVSLINPSQGLWAEILGNFGLRCAIIYYLVRDQVKQYSNIDVYSSPEKNAEGERYFTSFIRGQQKEGTLVALHEALVDFFPEEAMGLNAALEQWRKTRRLVEEQLPKMYPKMDQMMERMVLETYQKMEVALDKPNLDDVQATLTQITGKISTDLERLRDSTQPPGKE